MNRTAPDRLSLLRQICQAESSIELDLAREMDQQLLAGTYGDDHFSLQMPILHGIYRQTVQNSQNNIVQADLMADRMRPSSGEGFADGSSISVATYESAENILRLYAVTSLKEHAHFIDGHLEVYAGGTCIGKHREITDSAQHAESQFVLSLQEPLDGSERLEIYYTAVFCPTNGENVRTFLTALSCEASVLATSLIKSISLDFPSNIHTPPGSDIKVCYGRYPSASETVDMSYPSDIKAGKQRLSLDFKGKVELDLPEDIQFEEINIRTFDLKLDCKSGFAVYKLAYFDDSGKTVDRTRAVIDSFRRTPSGFSFELDKDWKGFVPAMSLPAREKVSLSFRVEFWLSNRAVSAIQISSTMEAPGIKKIPQLLLLWSCLAKGSLIEMADGTQKPIELIREGEKVLTGFTGATATVSCLWKGMAEEALLRIVSEQGHAVECSVSHPLITTEGVLPASEVNLTHLLIDREGGHVGIASIGTIPATEVFNLTLVPDAPEAVVWERYRPVAGATMICNGILVGDNDMQNSITLEKETPAFNQALIDEVLKNAKKS